MLVASQVLLSIVLPTVIFPLVYICSRAELMTVESPVSATGTGQKRNFGSPAWLTWLGYALFVVLLGANVYTIVELGQGVS
jgi:metal iron transporter